jgi:regulation of enolase protein 1 (concanavalin A-like superfamily)
MCFDQAGLMLALRRKWLTASRAFSGRLAFLSVEPRFDNVRSDPRLFVTITRAERPISSRFSAFQRGHHQ